MCPPILQYISSFFLLPFDFRINTHAGNVRVRITAGVMGTPARPSTARLRGKSCRDSVPDEQRKFCRGKSL
jgi:hypothetical protein